MTIGSVVWFNRFKGYGFIRPDGGGKDVFVHMSAVEQAGLQTLVAGQRVSYELVICGSAQPPPQRARPVRARCE
ncbi:cold-shock protein [Bradyrhizobium iriomotense]|uniref:cold-shock protein n=1 Tax=Bradyrhizobium iriomotense TaxID=441950 RepID=UPI001B8A0A8F|nr:cold-shock protein [Bradyrhizobium iriomotense]MBR1133863.1 cold-shock protein [Bradyrhizobium iriomotense]